MSLFYVLNHSAYGLLAITVILTVSVMTDQTALMTGILFGKKKLCPLISPKKTVAGAVGGVVGGVIGVIIPFLLFDVFNVFAHTNYVEVQNLGVNNLYIAGILYFVIAVIGSIADEVGDLVASWIKRNAGLKDFGKIFPGHGGVMDRIDGMMYTLVSVYIFFVILIRIIQ
jgi:phosphatidate cytidylyltransferase